MSSVTETVHVDLDDRSYDILIGQGLIGSAGELLGDLGKGRKVFVITDDNVASLHLSKLVKSFQAASLNLIETIIVPSGEASKSFVRLEQLLSELLEKGLDRKSLIVAFGGGVIGDLVGFAASIALRGVDFIQIPTTLLAQVDSSVGGKTAINVPAGKNLVGSFYQPKTVLIDVDVLETLPKRHMQAGYAEMVKYGLIDDAAFFEFLEQKGQAILALDKREIIKAVAHNCHAKARIVSEDETEIGRRALLNLGHTFAHAYEAETHYSDVLIHGEAVAIGMRQAFDFSEKMGFCQADDARKVELHLQQLGLKTHPSEIDGDWDFSPQTIVQHMQKDKKTLNGELTLILAKGIGQSYIAKNVSQADVISFLEQDVN